MIVGVYIVVPEKDKGRDGQDVMVLQNRNKIIKMIIYWLHGGLDEEKDKQG